MFGLSAYTRVLASQQIPLFPQLMLDPCPKNQSEVKIKHVTKIFGKNC